MFLDSKIKSMLPSNYACPVKLIVGFWFGESAFGQHMAIDSAWVKIGHTELV